MLLRKIDGKSVFVRKRQNGKFKGPDWRASYCPEDAQRLHAEASARDKVLIPRDVAHHSGMISPTVPI